VSIRKLGLGGFVTVLWVMVLGAMALPALAAVETPEGEAVGAVTATTAHVSGVLNPKASGEVAHGFYGFFYGLSEPTVCGQERLVPEPFGEAGLAAGLPKEAVSSDLSGLQPHAKYTFCLIEENTEFGEETFGAPVPFETLPAGPSIDSETASGVTSTAATLEALVNANNQSTTFSFEYATEASGQTLKGTVVKVAGENPLEGYGDQTATVPVLTGLTPGKTYFFRVVAENAQSKLEKVAVKGTVSSFTTVPTPTTLAPTLVTATTATFNGELSSFPAGTMFSFDYALGTECTGGLASTPETAAAKAVASNITELQPNASYAACLVSSNASGSERAAGVPFTTLAAPPSVKGATASEERFSAVVLSSSVNPNNEESTYAFEYATSEAALGTGAATTVAGVGPLAASFGDIPVSASTGTLAPRTTYFFRAVAENAQSVIEKHVAAGPTGSFTTLSLPEAETGAASAETRTSAELSGAVNPGGVPTTFHFVYVRASEYLPGAGECPPGDPCAYAHGRSTLESQSVGADYTSHPVGLVEVRELVAGETYDYAIVATNEEGSTVGANLTFTTSPGLPPLPPGPGPGETAPVPVSSPFTLPGAFPFVPYTPVAQVQAQQAKERAGTTTTTTTKPLTKAQQRAKALKACRKDKSKTKRTKCERQANRKAQR
jgi:hypothetical protein